MSLAFKNVTTIGSIYLGLRHHGSWQRICISRIRCYMMGALCSVLLDLFGVQWLWFRDGHSIRSGIDCINSQCWPWVSGVLAFCCCGQFAECFATWLVHMATLRLRVTTRLRTPLSWPLSFFDKKLVVQLYVESCVKVRHVFGDVCLYSLNCSRFQCNVRIIILFLRTILLSLSWSTVLVYS